MPSHPTKSYPLPHTPQTLAEQGKLRELAYLLEAADGTGEQSDIVYWIREGLALSAQKGWADSLFDLHQMDGLPPEVGDAIEPAMLEMIGISKKNGWANPIARLLAAPHLSSATVSAGLQALDELIVFFADHHHPDALLNILSDERSVPFAQVQAQEGLRRLARNYARSGHLDYLHYLYNHPDLPSQMREEVGGRMVESFLPCIQNCTLSRFLPLLGSDAIPAAAQSRLLPSVLECLQSTFSNRKWITLAEFYGALPLLELPDATQGALRESLANIVGCCVKGVNVWFILKLHEIGPPLGAEERILPEAEARLLAYCAHRGEIGKILRLMQHPGPNQSVKRVALVALRHALPIAAWKKKTDALASVCETEELPADIRADAERHLVQVMESYASLDFHTQLLSLVQTHLLPPAVQQRSVELLLPVLSHYATENIWPVLSEMALHPNSPPALRQAAERELVSLAGRLAHATRTAALLELSVCPLPPVSEAVEHGLLHIVKHHRQMDDISPLLELYHAPAAPPAVQKAIERRLLEFMKNWFIVSDGTNREIADALARPNLPPIVRKITEEVLAAPSDRAGRRLFSKHLEAQDNGILLSGFPSRPSEKTAPAPIQRKMPA